MALSIFEAFRPSTVEEWKRRILDSATKEKLTPTAWQSGSVVRTILSVVAWTLQFQDAIISSIAQGGFLDSAASGTVEYKDPFGNSVTSPVTPEGGEGWLDILTDGVYDTQRLEEGFAGGLLGITNTGASGLGVFVPGVYHVANPNTKQGYANTERFTLPPSSVVGTSVAGVTNVGGAIQVETSANHGLSDGDIVSVRDVHGIPPLLSPTAWRVDVTAAKTFILRGSVYSGSYTGSGTVYAPTVIAVRADVAGSVGDTLDINGRVAANTVTTAVTSLINVFVANVDPFYGVDTEGNVNLAKRAKMKLRNISPNGPRGAHEYVILSATVFAEKLVPTPVLSTPVTRVTVAREWTTGFVYAFCANPSGPPSDADLAVLNRVVQAFVTPNGNTSVVLGATPREVRCAAEVWLPPEWNTTTIRAAFQTAIQDRIKVFPIGGITDPRGRFHNVITADVLEDAINDVADELGFPIQNAIVELDGARYVQLQYDPSNLIAEVVVLAPAVPTIRLTSVVV